MSDIVFRAGVNHWDHNFGVEFKFFYSADLEKEISEAIFHDLDNKQSIRIPWVVLKGFLTGLTTTPYTDFYGVTLRACPQGLEMSFGNSLPFIIYSDQMDAILRRAVQLKHEITSDIKRLRHLF